MKKLYIVSLTLTTFGLASNVCAFDVAVGAKVSTLGVGIDFTTPLTEKLNLRAGIQGFEYRVDVESDGVDYDDADLELFSGLMVADWYPFGGVFRITGGVLINDNKVSGTGKPAPGIVPTFTVNDNVYNANNNDKLDAEISYNAVAPYFGIGWGNPVRKESNWFFFCDIGVVFMGSPDVAVSASGPLANNAVFIADLEEERKDLEDDLDSYKYYPVISLGLNYKF
jgi:hypothetical protein